jgi:hypothetical protein
MIDGAAAAGTITTLGASSTVTSTLESGLANVYGAGATANSSPTGGTEGTTASTTETDVLTLQSVLNGLSLPSSNVLLPGNIATAPPSFSPGVYKVTGLKTVTAGVTITLDAGGLDNQEFIFNISSYLTFGAGVKVKVENDPNSTAKVFWNAGGYISIGADAEIVGTVLAHTYVNTGAGSLVCGPNGNCGGAVYSATSYVSVGAAYATVGTGTGCDTVAGCLSCDIHLIPGTIDAGGDPIPADNYDRSTHYSQNTVRINWEKCLDTGCNSANGDFYVVIGPDGTGGRTRTRTENCATTELTGLYYDPCDDHYEVWLFYGPGGDGCGAELVCEGPAEKPEV